MCIQRYTIGDLTTLAAAISDRPAGLVAPAGLGAWVVARGAEGAGSGQSHPPVGNMGEPAEHAALDHIDKARPMEERLRAHPTFPHRRSVPRGNVEVTLRGHPTVLDLGRRKRHW